MRTLLRVVPKFSSTNVTAAASAIETSSVTAMPGAPPSHLLTASNMREVSDKPPSGSIAHAHKRRDEFGQDTPLASPLHMAQPRTLLTSYESHPAQTVRKLRAIVCLDVVGYSRMMELDEIGTDARLEQLFSEIVLPAVARHGGEIDHLAGDGVLAHFSTAISALRCSIEIQDALHSENQSLLRDRWIQFRIGINLGEVIVRGTRIAGHGVNLAARLQTVSKSGQICVSETVRANSDAYREFEFVSMGYHRLKNIQQPIRAYAILSKEVAKPLGSLRTLVRSPALIYKGSIVFALHDVFGAAVQWCRSTFIIAPKGLAKKGGYSV